MSLLGGKNYGFSMLCCVKICINADVIGRAGWEECTWLEVYNIDMHKHLVYTM